MNIPKSYEALATDLDSEKIISKTMHGQKEMYMMLADQRKVELDEALAREAGLREDLRLAKKLQTTTDSIVVMVDGQRDHWIEKCGAIKQRLTVAEQRNADNLKLISGLVEYADNLLADVNNAWSYAGSTGDPETHKDEDYAAALNLLSATVSSHE